MNLLTPKQVAEILQISTRTVYENKHRLGGFYPAGIRVLRFRKEVIYGLMERQETGGLGVRFPAQGETVRRQGIQNEGRGEVGQGEAQKGNKEYQTDPARHGL
ncbi:MAG: helix-turn-helix domain-containing protein [Desulfobacterales bacterium]|nr:helix-turn-helix domain-containing protein [Desulfobacterales bacterium]